MTDEATTADQTPTDMTTTGHRPRWKRDTAVFLSGQTVSMFGSMLVQYAIMWYLTILTESGVVLMLSAVFGMLPQAIVSIFGGVWADRLNRKRLIIIADASIAVTTLALALFMLSGYSELWLIFLTLAIRSTGAGIQQPAVAALIPQLVPTPHLLRVNGIFQSISSAMMLVAPAAAGAIYAGAAEAWGPDSAIIPIFFIDVVTAVIGIGFLLAIAVPTVRAVVDTGYFADLVKGVKYTFTHRFVRWLLALFAVIFILTVAPSMLTPLMVVRSFGSDDGSSDVWLLTVNELAFSIGMLLGGILIATWGGLKNKVAHDHRLVGALRRVDPGARPVDERLGVLRLHVPGRPRGAVLLDPGDDPACRSASRWSTRAASSASWASSWRPRCRSAWCSSARSPTSCRSNWCSSAPGSRPSWSSRSRSWCRPGARRSPAVRTGPGADVEAPEPARDTA